MIAENTKTTQRHRSSRDIEEVLVLQGGGSLGAFACGVFKGMYDSGIRFDIVGGTSIGAINAAIICGSRSDEPAKDLENFWIEIAESSYNVAQDMFVPYCDFLGSIFGSGTIPLASLNAIMFGVPKFFVPRWFGLGVEMDIPYSNWTSYYDQSPLVSMLDKYVNYDKISNTGKQNGSSNNPRMIATAVNVLTAKALVFDSLKMEIKPKHILASSAYSSYGFPWIEIDSGVYAWDGGLLSNTPLQEIMEASPRNDKHVHVIENYPRRIDKLPVNISEVMDRTRDIIFSDKTIYDLRTWKHVSRQSEFIEKLFDVFEKAAEAQSLEESTIRDIRKEYDDLVGNYGAEILSIHRIVRDRMKSPYLLKNTDFSVKTVKDLIRQGEKKALDHLQGSEDPDMVDLARLLYLK